MSTTIGDLLIKLGADVASLRTDMAESRRVVSSAMADVQRSVAGARAALGGLAAAFAAVGSAGWLVELVNSTADAEAKLHDLNLTTGISVSTLSALEDLGRLSGTSIDSLSGAVVKLAKNLVSADEESKGTAQAIKALGLDFDAFKAMQPDGQMLAVARAMNDFKDGTTKAAAAQMLFGKEGAKLIPFLKDLATEQKLLGSLTDEAASAADEYTDNLTKLSIQSQRLKRDALNPVISDLAILTGKLLEADSASAKFGVALRTIWDNFRNTRSLLNPFKLFADDEVTSKLQKAIDKKASPLGLSSALSTMDKPSLDLPTDADRKAAEAAAKRAKAYADLIEKIRERGAAEDFEAQIGRKLSEGERQALDLMVQLRDGTRQMSQEERIGLGVELERQLAAEKRNAQKQRELKWLEETGDENAKAIEAAMAQADAYREQMREAQALNATYGMTQEQLQALESKRLRDAAATLEQRAAYRLATDAGTALAQAEQDQAAILRRTAAERDALARKQELDRTDPLRGASQGVRDYLREIESAGEATRNAVQRGASTLEDTLVETFATGKLNASSFVDFVIREFLRLQVVRPLMQDLLGSGGSLFSLFGGGGVAGGTGMPTDAGSMPMLDVASAGPGASVGMAKTTVVYSPTISIDARSDVAQVSALVREGVTQGQKQLIEDLRAAGKV